MKGFAPAFVTLAAAAALTAQTTTPPAPQQRAPGEPQNVQVLKGLSQPELIRAMQFMSASLGVNCDFCHVFKPGNQRDFASDDKEEKRTAREMIRLVIDTNTKYFHGNSVVSCNTCHRGSTRPVGVPVLPIAAPQRPAEPAAPSTAEQKPAMPARDDIVARYANALGKVDAKALTSIELKGTREMAQANAPIDVLQTSGRTRINVTTPEGEMVNVLGDNGGWVRDARGTRGMPPVQYAMTRQLLEALRLPLPGEIPAEARVSKDRVGDRDVWVLTSPVGTGGRQRLYFDAGTGLLVRRLTLTQSPVGMIPQQTDFEDYRDVGGFKLPFVVRYDAIDRNGGVVRYTAITPNAKIDEKIFDMPKP